MGSRLHEVLSLRRPAFWRVAPAALRSAGELFRPSVYQRGAGTLEALRGRIGGPTFERLLRRWYAEHRGGTAGTRQFVALAEEVSGRELLAFFRAWLHRRGEVPRRFR